MPMEQGNIPHDVTGLAVMVGEIRGQMREVVHTLNNVSAKIDGLSREVVAMGPLAAEIAELKGEIKVAQAEINALKESKSDQKAQVRLLDWIVRNWVGITGIIMLLGFILKEWKL